MRLRTILCSFAALALAWACTEPVKPEVKAELQIPQESQAAFSSGIAFDGASAQSAQLKFTATADWTASVADTKASGWLSVSPASGGAGAVTLTISAQANPDEAERSAKLTLVCGQNYVINIRQAGTPPAVIPVSGIVLNKTELSMEIGESETLTATVSPDNATDKTVKWSSSDKAVATVENGKVTALAAGQATITAVAGEQVASCKVTVNEPAPVVIAVESVTLDKTELTLEEGETAQLTATVAPDDATDKTVTWSSSDPAIATVENGKVTAVKAGEAVITAKAGEKSATCTVTVNASVPPEPQDVPVESVTLDKPELALEIGQTATLVATVSPDDATDKTVTWTSSNDAVATVDQNGKVTAVAEGTAIITAKAGEKSATCTVTVKAPAPPSPDDFSGNLEGTDTEDWK